LRLNSIDNFIIIVNEIARRLLLNQNPATQSVEKLREREKCVTTAVVN
jgi:hypothetical protein